MNRKQWKEKRRQIPGRDEKNRQIVARLLPFLSSDTLTGFYVPLPEEADVLAAAKTLRFAAPRVISETQMKFFMADTLIPGTFGVLEPLAGDEVVPDTIIIPMLAFCEGYRIGYGRGYYDRYLSEHPQCRRIGIAYDEQEARFTPKPWDQRMDVLITPTRVLHYPRDAHRKEVQHECS